MPRTPAQVGQDIRWGLIWVAPYTIFFWLLSLIGQLLGVQFAGLTIVTAALMFLGLGLLTGVLVGVFRPIAGTIRGPAIIGALVGIGLAFVLHLMVDGLGNWHLSEILFFAIMAGICSFCAVGFRRGVMRAEAKRRGELP